MTNLRVALVARMAAIVSGILLVTVSVTLVVDGLAEVGRDAQEAARVEALEARVPTESEAAAELARETEVQTERSLRRAVRNERLGWVLLAAAVAFFGSAKMFVALRQEEMSSLIRIGTPMSGDESPTLERPTRSPVIEATPAPVIPEPIDLDFVDRVIAAQGRDREATIPILQALQSQYRYLPAAALQRVCERTEIGPSQIIGVASFYAQFRRNPVGRRLVRLCHGTACHVAGIGPITDELRRRLQIPPDADTDAERRFTIESVNCLGCCSLAPVMMVEDRVAGRLTPTGAWQRLEQLEVET